MTALVVIQIDRAMTDTQRAHRAHKQLILPARPETETIKNGPNRRLTKYFRNPSGYFQFNFMVNMGTRGLVIILHGSIFLLSIFYISLDLARNKDVLFTFCEK